MGRRHAAACLGVAGRLPPRGAPPGTGIPPARLRVCLRTCVIVQVLQRRAMSQGSPVRGAYPTSPATTFPLTSVRRNRLPCDRKVSRS